MAAKRTQPSVKKMPKPTAAQQRARRLFVQRSGYKFTAEELEKVRAQWKG